MKDRWDQWRLKTQEKKKQQQKKRKGIQRDFLIKEKLKN